VEEDQISFPSDAHMADGVEDYAHQIAEMIGLRNEFNFNEAGVSCCHLFSFNLCCQSVNYLFDFHMVMHTQN
jgi:hypothetical protein